MITDARGVTIRVDRFGQVKLVGYTQLIDVASQRAAIASNPDGNGIYVVTTAAAVRACRVCGCTDARACPGGCFWVGPVLCSRCQS